MNGILRLPAESSFNLFLINQTKKNEKTITPWGISGGFVCPIDSSNETGYREGDLIR